MADRKITEVIDAMLVHVPAGLVLRAELTKLRSDACYLAPERMSEAWGYGGRLLAEAFGPVPPTDGWEGLVVRIWMGTEAA